MALINIPYYKLFGAYANERGIGVRRIKKLQQDLGLDYVTIFGKRPINQDPVDEYVSPKEKIYLVRYDTKLRQAERTLNKKFVRYPFSNTPPINILEEGERFVDKNMSRWIEEALEEAQKEFVRTYRGARL